MYTRNYTARTFGLAALAATMTWGTMFAAHAQSGVRDMTLEAGSVLPVRLDNELSSNNTHKGDTFTVTLRNDTDAEYYHLPTGTHIEGIVRDARPKRDKDPGVLDLDFRRLRLPDGKSYAIQGSLIGLDNKSVEKRSDGRLVAKPGHANDRLTYVGYGAGAGLIVGLLTKHGLEDTAIGGGLGYLFGALQKGQTQTRDVDLKPGSELGVRLDQSVMLASYGTRDDYNNYHARNDDTGRFHRDDATRNTNGGVNRDSATGANVGRGDSRDTGGYRRDDTTVSRDDNNRNRDDRRGDYRQGDDRRSDDRRSTDNGSDLNRTNDLNRDRADRDRDRTNGDRSDDRGSDRAGYRNIGVLVGDRNVSFDSTARPFMSKGVLMVPVRNVLSTAHIPLTFNTGTQEIRAAGDGGSVRLAIGSAIAVVNGDRRVRLDAPAQQLNGTTYVPIRFFSLVTGQEATYDTASRTVQVNLRNDAGDRINR